MMLITYNWWYKVSGINYKTNAFDNITFKTNKIGRFLFPQT